jgi:hypothetical protein
MRLVVAIEPRSYRQVIGEAIRVLRPHVEVTVLEPGMLGAGLRRLEPELVFADQPDTFGPEGESSERPAWVEFRPYEEPPARVYLAGRRWELEAVELSDLLSIVDQTEELTRTAGREQGECY